MHELKLIVDLMYRGGLNFMRFSVSRYRRVRRLRQRPARGGRRQGDHEGRPDRHPDGRLRGQLDRRDGGRWAAVPADAQGGPRPPDRAGRCPAAGRRCCGSTRSRSRQARHRHRRPEPPRERHHERLWRSHRLRDSRGQGVHPHLRHHAAGWRAGAGCLADHHREAGGRPPAGAPQRRRHRGRLPGRLTRRLGGGQSHRPGDPGRRSGGPRPLQGRRSAARRGGAPCRGAAASPRVHLDQRHPPGAPDPDVAARRPWPRRSSGSATAGSSWAATRSWSSAPWTPPAATRTT